MRSTRIGAALLGLALIATACGGSSASESTTTSVASGPAPSDATESDIPAVDVVDLATGETVNLTSLAPSDRPILLWFWAPH